MTSLKLVANRSLLIGGIKEMVRDTKEDKWRESFILIYLVNKSLRGPCDFRTAGPSEIYFTTCKIKFNVADNVHEILP